MKKILFVVLILIVMCNTVYSESHDVQAKYDKNYNVELNTITLNNNTKTLTINDYSFEFSTELNDIEIVVIKVENEANDYVKTFTKNDNNYYLGFFKDNKKISTSDIKIKIKNNDKVLNIYDNSGKIIDSSNQKISLNGNNYFMSINEKIEHEEEYKIVDINSIAKELEELEDNNYEISLYNSKNNLVNNDSPLGTGYKVIANKLGEEKEFKIVVKGDTTGDAKINLNDITRLYHYYKKIENMDEPFVLAGDVANNDIINLNDITKIYHYYKKIIPNL